MIKLIHRNTAKVFKVVASTLLLGTISPQIHAEPVPIDFWCANTGTEFKTHARYSDRSEKPIIIWSNHLEGQSPEERCRGASKQYRINYANGFNYLATGLTSFGKPVICAVKAPTSDLVKCSQLNILLDLGKNDDASLIKRSLEQSVLNSSSNMTEQSSREDKRTGQRQFRNDSSQPNLENRRGR